MLAYPDNPPTTTPDFSVWPMATGSFLVGELEKLLPFFQPLTPPRHTRNSEKSHPRIFSGEGLSGGNKSETSCSDNWGEPLRQWGG